MKRLLILIALVILTSFIFAASVSQSNVLATANNWINVQKNTSQTVANFTTITDSMGVVLIYKINFSPAGFVIMSADDRVFPMLGYSETGQLNDSLNPEFEMLLLDFRDEISYIISNNLSNVETSAQWASLSNNTVRTVPVEIDMGATWDQVYGYQNCCPKINVTPTYVGCVATAMAQIVNYNQSFNASFVRDHLYTSIRDGYSIRIWDETNGTFHFPRKDEMNTMLTAVRSKFSHGISLDIGTDRAAVGFACGVLTETKYGWNTGSPAYTIDADDVFGNLGYHHTYCEKNPDDIFVHDPTPYEWRHYLIDDIDDDHPVLYSGGNRDGYSHCFVVCGYKAVTDYDGYIFKIKWGYGLTHPGWDGYFHITNLNPDGNNNYGTRYNEMIRQIYPYDVSIFKQSITLGNAPLSGTVQMIIKYADGYKRIINANENGVFNARIPYGTYDITIRETSGNYEEYKYYGIEINSLHTCLSVNAIDLKHNPDKLIIVPTDYLTIQEAINHIQNNGTVQILNRTQPYSVEGLRWEDKHIKLRGQSTDGVKLINNNNIQAIWLNWEDINNTDILQNLTFQNCNLSAQMQGGSAIALWNGASPQIINCNFKFNNIANMYSNSGNANYNWLTGYGVGGAVLVGGKTNQTNTPKFYNCNFTSNFTSAANGGGAVALYGRAIFDECTFLSNFNLYNANTPAVAGAVFISTFENPGYIQFQRCNFLCNMGVLEAHDIFVNNVDKLDSLKIENCSFSWVENSGNVGNKPSIKILQDRATNLYGSTMHAKLIIRNNTFLCSNEGAVYFCDYEGRNNVDFTGNVISGTTVPGYGFYLRYHGGNPINPAYFKFDNNTVKNINGKGLVLFEGADYTLNNNIFEGCSTVGISWGEYETGHPSWRTTSLTTKYCLLNNSANYDDYGTNGHHLTQVSNIWNISANLDSNFVPSWALNNKSMCIDNGNPDLDSDNSIWYKELGYADKDPDGSQMDIGAKPYYDQNHRNSVVRLSRNEEWNWICIPAVTALSSQGLDHDTYVFDTYHNNDLYNRNEGYRVLDQLLWQYNSDRAGIIWDPYLEISGIVGNFVRPDVEQHIRAQYGYKIDLNQANESLGEFKYLEYSGCLPGGDLNPIPSMVIESPTASNNGTCFFNELTQTWERETWLGYYNEKSLDPFDALQPILSNIVSIKTQEWAMSRQIVNGQYTNLWEGKTNAERHTAFNYGEAVVVRYIGHEPAEFIWGNTYPLPPEWPHYERQAPEYFTYEKKADYLPIYATIDFSQYLPGEKPIEVAVFVDGKCVGAEKIDSEQLSIKAYLTSDEISDIGDKIITFELKSPDKGANDVIDQFAVHNPITNTFVMSNSIPEYSHDYMTVSLSPKDITNAQIPVLTKLGNNYPNPFNPETTIKYDLAQSGVTKLEIFNVKGQLIKSLVNGKKDAGCYSAKWNGTDDNGKHASSGIYFYRLTAAGKTLTNKMIMLK